MSRVRHRPSGKTRGRRCRIALFLITFGVGLTGGLLFYRLKVPGGMMVGSIVLVSLFSILTGSASMPYEAKLTAQSLAGAFIACGTDWSDLKGLAKLLKPAVVLLSAVLVLNLLLGFLIWLCGGMDLLTALLCAVPGGMSDTPIIAADLGADAPKVAVLQFVRMSSGIGLFPSLIVFLTRGEPETESQTPRQIFRTIEKAQRTDVPLTIAAALLCGILGSQLDIPASTLILSMFGVIALKMVTGRARLPLWAKRLAQVLSGAYIGCGMTKADLLELRHLIFPAMIILTGYFANSILTGRLLHRMFGFPLKTAMLAATPAGASDMALISADIGADSRELVELQVIRLVVVVSLFPQIIVRIATAFDSVV